MKLHNTVNDTAVLSNVGEIGEFRIRNSAKAFNILSSGLYANKIRAIIRELSCNAVDSHKAAGKDTTPFDVHLPSLFEPWFSIRDYGTGLTHEQVTNIYTTYFESTKTNSNDFIGALGLGSKSPFSYTDNFTVTAIKDGRKGVYTAFINDQGVPSIALMMEEQTNDPAGVEVKFAVESNHDFAKFNAEAAEVYTYFKLRPVVTGKNFSFKNIKYRDENVVPGVHYLYDQHTSIAIMGNIAYPIQVPNKEQVLGKLSRLLDFGLAIEFDIGELDFQASREGLSYIPQTINAIKKKLSMLDDNLYVLFENEANKITNLWERAFFLYNKSRERLWSMSVSKYVAKTKFPLSDSSGYPRKIIVEPRDKEMYEKYNIKIVQFIAQGKSVKVPSYFINNDNKGKFYEIPVGEAVYFVVDDTNKVGAIEKIKYDWSLKNVVYTNTILLLQPFDKNLPMDTDNFFKSIHNPMPDRIITVSNLKTKPRKNGQGDVSASILKLDINHYNEIARWKLAGNTSDYDDNTTYYYLPLNNRTVISVTPKTNERHTLCEVATMMMQMDCKINTIYGVRVSDIEVIRKKTNWVNLETHIIKTLQSLNSEFILNMVNHRLDIDKFYMYNVKNCVNQNSPYLSLYEVFTKVNERHNIGNVTHTVFTLCNLYKDVENVGKFEILEKFNECQQKVNYIKNRYSLISHLNDSYHGLSEQVTEYINAIDNLKGDVK